MMKHIWIIFLISGLISCGGPQADSEGVAAADSDTARAVSTQRVSVGGGVLESFAAVQRTLDSIRRRQALIAAGAEKVKISDERLVSVNSEILTLNNFLEKQRQEAVLLNEKIRLREGMNSLLKDSIAMLNKQLAETQAGLRELGYMLEEVNADFGEVQSALAFILVQEAVKDAIYREGMREGRWVYYRLGSSKELRDANITDVRGGLLGIGRVTVPEGNFNLDEFSSGDYAELRSIPVKAKKLTMVTPHPDDAYELIKENGIIKEISIKDPVLFWQSSKVLVATVK